MKQSIFYKIFFGQLSIILIVLVFLLVFSFKILNAHHFESVFSNLRHAAICLIPSVSGLLDDGNHAALDDLIKDTGPAAGIRFTVISPSGMVLADSHEDPARMDNHLDRPEVASAFRDRKGESLRFSSTIRSRMLYAAVPVEKDGGIIAVLRGSRQLEGVMDALAGLKSSIFYAVLIAFLCSLVGAFILTSHITGPLKHISTAAARMAGGDFEITIPVIRKDETGRLAESFNTMAERVTALFSELSAEKGQLDAVIASMREGLILIDGNDRILRRNRSFEKIAGPCAEGKLYWECLRDYPVIAFIKAVREHGEPSVAEISSGGKVFAASAVNLPGKAMRTAVIFNDITELKNMEKAKRDFVANVSHELKTPLTALKGFTETLEGEVSEAGKGYLEIMRRHGDRLIKIVGDLLFLSRIESEEQALELAPVNIEKLARGVLGLFEQKASDKGIKLEFSAEENLPGANLDAFRIEQMLINLLENALNYTDKGGVRLSLESHDGSIAISVIDTGRGIEDGHLQHIFERFYVADKSRSRQTGGTGLGLSIVKHIVLSHNGDIKVDSVPGEGTAFRIVLPANLS